MPLKKVMAGLGEALLYATGVAAALADSPLPTTDTTSTTSAAHTTASWAPRLHLPRRRPLRLRRHIRRRPQRRARRLAPRRRHLRAVRRPGGRRRERNDQPRGLGEGRRLAAVGAERRRRRVLLRASLRIHAERLPLDARERGTGDRLPRKHR